MQEKTDTCCARDVLAVVGYAHGNTEPAEAVLNSMCKTGSPHVYATVMIEADISTDEESRQLVPETIKPMTTRSTFWPTTKA